MTPIRRDYKFTLDATRIRDWHGAGNEVTHFFNALSIFFPVGERFFIQSIRNYRDRVADPKLKAEVTAFIGQEAMHGREHEAFNDALGATGLPVAQLEKLATEVLGVTQKLTPQMWQLAVTMALEHFTATYADRLLANRALLDEAAPHFKQLWLWHALEETEHKAVAFDVWRSAFGTGAGEYAVRAAAMVVTWAVFTAIVGINTVTLVEAEGRAPRKRARRYATLGKFLMARRGMLRDSGKALLDYFRPDFHPWMHDNREVMQRLPEVSEHLRLAA